MLDGTDGQDDTVTVSKIVFFFFVTDEVTVISDLGNEILSEMKRMWLYQPLDGCTNLKYKLLCFLTPNKKSERYSF
jgi:hypothetical protein